MYIVAFNGFLRTSTYFPLELTGFASGHGTADYLVDLTSALEGSKQRGKRQYLCFWP